MSSDRRSKRVVFGVVLVAGLVLFTIGGKLSGRAAGEGAESGCGGLEEPGEAGRSRAAPEGPQIGRPISGLSVRGKGVTRVNRNNLTFAIGSGLEGCSNASVKDAELVCVRSDGTVLRGRDLEGVSLEATLDDGAKVPLRITSIGEREGGLFSYFIVAADSGESACPVAAGASPDAFALAEPHDLATGAPLADPGAIHFACRGSALYSCLSAGYRPWTNLTETLGDRQLEQPGAPFLQACARLVRGDYCGDGTSHAPAGASVAFWDTFGVNDEPSGEAAAGLELEGEWSTNGASCITRVRWPEALEWVSAHCPERLADRSAEAGVCGKSGSSFNTEIGARLSVSQRPLLRSAFVPRP
jgi:hypothetical protein